MRSTPDRRGSCGLSGSCFPWFEEGDPEWGQGHAQVLGAAQSALAGAAIAWLGPQRTVSHATAAKLVRVAVQRLVPGTGHRHRHGIVVAYHRGEVADDH